jgi:hypothetical protein
VILALAAFAAIVLADPQRGIGPRPVPGPRPFPLPVPPIRLPVPPIRLPVPPIRLPVPPIRLPPIYRGPRIGRSVDRPAADVASTY